MQAIMHGKKIDHPRGTPPKSVAAKYSSGGDKAPEQSGKNRGGSWNKKKDKKKKDMKKSFEQYYKGQGAGVVVINEKGQVLVGQGYNGKQRMTLI